MNQVCRVCLSRVNLISIFNKQNDLQISQKIMSLAAVTITVDDMLPPFICSNCVSRLEQCYIFKLDCERSDAHLRSQLALVSDNSEIKTHENIQANEDFKDTEIFAKREDDQLKLKAGKPTQDIKKEEVCLQKNLHQSEDVSLADDQSEKTSDKMECESRTHSPLDFGAKTDNVKRKKHKKQQCFTCGKVLSSRFRLKTHLRIHTGEKPFACVQCNKTFTQANCLKVHERIHTGEKPLACNICGKKFAHSAGLITHKRLHTGETPYSCTLCEAKFRTASNLHYHIRMHTGEKKYECDACGRAFIANGDFKRHKQTHTGDRPHVCCVCGLRLVRAYHLKRHMAIHNVPIGMEKNKKNTDLANTTVLNKSKKITENSCIAGS